MIATVERAWGLVGIVIGLLLFLRARPLAAWYGRKQSRYGEAWGERVDRNLRPAFQLMGVLFVLSGIGYVVQG